MTGAIALSDESRPAGYGKGNRIARETGSEPCAICLDFNCGCRARMVTAPAAPLRVIVSPTTVATEPPATISQLIGKPLLAAPVS